VPVALTILPIKIGKTIFQSGASGIAKWDLSIIVRSSNPRLRMSALGH
jgi:hypothetical protein